MNLVSIKGAATDDFVCSEQGSSVIGMAVLMLLLGSAMLNTAHKQLRDSLTLLVDERQYLIDFHQALSAQSWGTRLNWPQKKGWHCKQEIYFRWQACVLWLLDEQQALLRGSSLKGDKTNLSLWQWLQPINEEKVKAKSHGWIDFCPLKEIHRCYPDAP